MDEQDGWSSNRDNDPAEGRHEPVRSDAGYRSGYSREVYSDAHYEAADESTIPPRYYTPPDRAPRDSKAKVKKSSGGTATGLLCAVLTAGIVSGLCGAGLTEYRMRNQIAVLSGRLAEVEATLLETRTTLEQSSQDAVPMNISTGSAMKPSDIYDLAKRQVVGIRTEVSVTNFFGMTSSGAVNGSGFFISPDGYILTNYHVVEDAYNGQFDIEVITYDGVSYSATIVGVEPANDIAVLKIDADGLSTAKLGNSNDLLVGDKIYAVGNPLGELEFSMSTGYISALDRVIHTQEGESINMFQIDAAVNEGNSGGPLYASDGSVVGIVTAKYSSSGVEGLGFAVPINDARTIAEDLVTKGYVTGKAYLGVILDHRYNSMYSQYYGLPLGAYVADITPGSAADKAGLQIGDVITAVGEYSITSYDELKTALRHFSAFDQTELSVFRAGSELKLLITFDEATPENS